MPPPDCGISPAVEHAVPYQLYSKRSDSIVEIMSNIWGIALHYLWQLYHVQEITHTVVIYLIHVYQPVRLVPNFLPLVLNTIALYIVFNVLKMVAGWFLAWRHQQLRGDVWWKRVRDMEQLRHPVAIFTTFDVTRDDIKLKGRISKSPNPNAKVMLIACPLGTSGPHSYDPIMCYFGPEFTYVTWDYRGNVLCIAVCLYFWTFGSARVYTRISTYDRENFGAESFVLWVCSRPSLGLGNI